MGEQHVPAHGADKQTAKSKKKQGRFQSELFDWAESILAALLLVVFVFTFLVRLTGVSGFSMQPTLQDRDIMLVSGLGYTPERGDVVVLNKKSFGLGTIVKRVIAVGGDTVDIDFAAGEVFVNGEQLDEPYINAPTYTDEGMQFPLTVPEGSVFVLGDNRNESTDSRDPRLGVVDERYIIGKALFVLFPFQSFGKVG